MKRAKVYTAADIEDSSKTKIARLYIIQHGRGKAKSEFVSECAEAGWLFSERQLQRWVAAINSGQQAVSTGKLAGAAPSLTRDERDISSGWVLDCVEHGVMVKLADFCRYVLDRFSIEIVPRTASNYLREDGFSYRLLQKKASSFVVDKDLLVSCMWKWAKSNQKSLKKIASSNLCSIDFTYTGHRTERLSGFGIKGGAQPMVAASISRFTNCIITCPWADGINRTPAVLFTYNQNFRFDRSPTKKRNGQVEYLRERLAHYGIAESRVIYIGKDKNEKETYARESPDLLRRFFAVYGIPEESTALSDNGNAFFENSESILRTLGFADHRFYPANVHQYLSINDNPLHGTSKGSWRASGVDFSNDVDSCLMLLSLLDRDITAHSGHWFKRNILELKEEDVEGIIGKRGFKKSRQHKEWLRAYRIFEGEDARGERPDVPEELRDGLDGLYWDK